MYIPDGELNGTLLTGRVVDFAAVAGGGTGQFQFRVAVTGGLLTNPFGGDANGPWCVGICYMQNNSDLIQPGQDLGINIASSQLTGSFATSSIIGTARGTAGTIVATSAMICTGIIGDRVWNDLNKNGIQDAGELGLEGAIVTLRHGLDPVKTANTDVNGNYVFTQVCGGDNQLDVAAPQWYAASPSNVGLDNADSDGSGVIVNLASGSVDRSVDFGFYLVPPISSAYTTFTDSAWGAKPKPGNAAKSLADYFSLLYPTGEVVVGIPNVVGRYSVTVTGAEQVQAFLPQGGKPAPLTASYIDPAHIVAGKVKGHLNISQLLGNVMALKFNVDFSNAGLTRVGLKDLKAKSGAYQGKTVAQILDMANKALAGDPAFTAYKDLSDTIDAINRNFNAGTTDKGFLVK
jgi:hypothetical protein